jgi:hypothetical protein
MSFHAISDRVIHARRHESRLRVRVMHKHQIGLAMRGRRQRLAGALSDYMHLDTRLGREFRQNICQQPLS